MTGSARALCWAYVLTSLFLAHCAATSVRADAWWYAAALFFVSLLLGVAFAREHVAADERRAAAVRAERAARLRNWSSQSRTDQEDGCCERWWTSCGAEHDLPHCARKDQAA
ncbi:hypothetical protein ACFYQA_02305 [Streptomyces sp. NPDC005774]|uniref:hypothetical protein n=1 Tax=Streptomyces sp. NPDC005774 TaxID=3364728 RepID=UPI003676944A